MRMRPSAGAWKASATLVQSVSPAWLGPDASVPRPRAPCTWNVPQTGASCGSSPCVRTQPLKRYHRVRTNRDLLAERRVRQLGRRDPYRLPALMANRPVAFDRRGRAVGHDVPAIGRGGGLESRIPPDLDRSDAASLSRADAGISIARQSTPVIFAPPGSGRRPRLSR